MHTLVNWSVLEWQFVSSKAVQNDSMYSGSKVFQTQYFRKITTTIQLYLRMELKKKNTKGVSHIERI